MQQRSVQTGALPASNLRSACELDVLRLRQHRAAGWNAWRENRTETEAADARRKARGRAEDMPEAEAEEAEEEASRVRKAGAKEVRRQGIQEGEEVERQAQVYRQIVLEDEALGDRS